MTTEIEIKDLTVAEDSYYKTQRIRVGNKNFVTPIKAIDLNKCQPSIGISNEIRGINEAYKIFDSEKIKKLLRSDREQEINNEIERTYKKYGSVEQVNLCFTEFEGDKLPTEEELEYLTNLAHVHSDITPLPLLPKLARKVNPDNLTNYTDFIRKAIGTIEELNNHPIMGILPMPVPSAFLPNILQAQLDLGVNAFCLDFQGSTVTSSKTKLRALIKFLKKADLLESVFIYSLNLGAGRLPKDRDIVSAKDILSFGYGLDVIGGQHIRRRLSPEVLAKILSAKKMFENSIRLFNKEDYGYYKATKSQIVEEVYPSDSSIPLSLLQRIDGNKGIEKLFNQEQQGFEAVHLRTVIAEEHQLLKYLGKKKQVEASEIKALENIKKKK